MAPVDTLPAEDNQSTSAVTDNSADVKRADELLLAAAARLKSFTKRVEESARVTEEQMRRCCCD